MSHICDDEIIEAGEFQKSIDEDRDYQFTTWREVAAEVDVDAPIELPKNINVAKPNLRETAVLLSVELHSVGNTRKLSVAQMEAIFGTTGKRDDDEVDKDRLGAHKKLLKSPELDALNSHDNSIRRFVANICLPSPFGGSRGGVYMVGYRLVEHTDKKLQEMLAERQRLKRDLIRAYPQRIKEAEVALGPKAFDIRDYATVEQLDEQIQLSWQFFELGAATVLQQISSDIWKREQSKIEQQWAEAQALAQSVMRAQMADLVDRMVERLTGEKDGKPKVFKNSLVGNMQEFLGLFEGRNITNDVQLAALVDRAKKLLNGVDADAIRDSDHTRQYVAKGFEQIKTVMAGMLQEKPKRAYSLEEE